MDATVWLLGIFTYLWNYVESVPPAACFTNFRWDDCGMPPKAVLYYYKPGSRCEVGFWRGCYPNPNMFKDEYECVNTCIFSVRAQPSDYHNLNEGEPHSREELAADTTDHEDVSTTPAGDKAEGSGDASGDGESKNDEGSGAESSGGGEAATASEDSATDAGEKATSPPSE